MKISYKILKQYLKTDKSASSLADELNIIGHEVENIENLAQKFEKFCTAQIISTKKHPSADKLTICTVDYGGESHLQIICGAKNAREGIKVVLAKIGAKMPSGFEIIERSIRDFQSFGMLCSADEIGINQNSQEQEIDGIIELPADTIIGIPIASYYGMDDEIIDISITPNRGDAISIVGIARDLAARGCGQFLADRILDDNQAHNHFQTEYDFSVESDKINQFLWQEIRGVKNCTSPHDLQNTLRNVGLKPINLFVDAVNYTSYITGQPLHAYDAAKISKNISVGHLQQDTKILCLDDKEYLLQKEDIAIFSKESNEVYAVAGIMGSKDSGCEYSTSGIIIEGAIFDHDSIMSTGRRLSIESDARYRFERQVCSQMTQKAIIMASNLIMKHCGGEISNIKQHVNPDKNTNPKSIEISYDYINQVLGAKIDKKIIISILGALGFAPSDEKEVIRVQSPSWRHDISIKEDIIEEILRIYGVDNIAESKMSFSGADFKENDIAAIYKKNFAIKKLLASRSCSEIITYSFIDEQNAKYFAPLQESLKINNPIASNQSYMRPSLLPGLLSCASANSARSVDNIALFEMGPVFSGTAREDQKLEVAAIRIGNISEKNPHFDVREANIYDAKADMIDVLSFYGVYDFKLSRSDASYLHPGRSGDVIQNDKIIARFGELHPNISKLFELNPQTRPVIFEVYIDLLESAPAACKADFIYSQFQPSNRDFAFLIDEQQDVGEIIENIENLGNKYIKNVNLFDIYTGDNVPEGKKSVAFSVRIQPYSANLTEKEIKSISEQITSLLSEKFKGVLRK